MGCLVSKPSIAECVQHIRGVIDILNTNIAAAEKQQSSLPYNHASRETSRALHYLKRAKQFDYQIVQLQKRVLTCTQKIITLQNMHMASMQLRAIHKTTKVFKDFTRQHDLDRVEKLQDELENGMERVMEVHDTLVQDTIDVDESDLESELNDLLLDMPEAPDSPLTHSSTHTHQHNGISHPDDHFLNQPSSASSSPGKKRTIFDISTSAAVAKPTKRKRGLCRANEL